MSDKKHLIIEPQTHLRFEINKLRHRESTGKTNQDDFTNHLLDLFEEKNQK